MSISNFCKSVAKLLETHLEFSKSSLRSVQVGGFEKLINFINSGKLSGLVKHPTGAGKTRFFCEVLSALNMPSLILVPRTNLVADTKESLVGNEMRDVEGVGYLEEDIFLLSDEFGKAAIALKSIFDNIIKMQDFGGVVIMSYQSFLSISKHDMYTLDDFMKLIKVVISDEAHRGLGDETQEVIKQYNDDIIGDGVDRVHLHMTATPQLGHKNVCDIYDIEVIDWVRVQDSVEDGILIMPQFRHFGTATYKTTDDIKFSDKFFESLAESEKFVMDNGQSVTEAAIDEYIMLKEKHDGYLPGVVFCGTIAHAEATKQYLLSRGLRAIRSTSSNKQYDCGVNPDRAREMFHSEEIDLVVTVSKVGEGWDVPTLRCAIWLRPVGSSAVYLQGTGRVMRTLLDNTVHAFKDRSNTYVIEPLWELVRVSSVTEDKKEDEHEKEIVENDLADTDSDAQTTVYPSRNGYEHFVTADEFDVEALRSIVGGDARIHMDIDFHNDEHLRILIGSVDKLIVKGKGVNLVKVTFINTEQDWKVTGRVIGRVLWNNSSPKIYDAEKLAKQLWPEEVENLLPKERFNPKDDNHLRILIGNVDNLIVNGKGVSLVKATFINAERGWKVTGGVIGNALWKKKSPNIADAEKLAKQLWLEEAEKLLDKK
ncbi:MAG: DEAD/DEAH box helicase [Candidatus Moraniibacteriota bacterium]